MTVKTTTEIVTMIHGLIAEGNRLALAVYGRDERYEMVRELVGRISQTKKVELIGFGTRYQDLHNTDTVNV